MDAKMFEHWGNMFLKAAASQQMLEDFFKLSGINTAGNYFLSGNKSFDTEAAFQAAGRAADIYKEFLNASLSVLNIVSREEYDRLEQENDNLKKEIARQEKIINDLKNLSGKSLDQEDIVSGFAQIMEKQTKHFQELMMQLDRYQRNAIAKKTSH